MQLSYTDVLVLPGVFSHVSLSVVQMSRRCINGKLRAAFVGVLLLAGVLATGCKSEPTLFGGCSEQVDICSECHPFYTGKQKLVDTAGRVERFRKKYAKNKGKKATAAPEAPADN